MQTMETMPLAIVTVPFPLFTSVTAGPVPSPPPGLLAMAQKTMLKHPNPTVSLQIRDLILRSSGDRLLFLPPGNDGRLQTHSSIQSNILT